MNCPICGERLVHDDLNDQGLMGVERCGKCGGCWVTHDELESYSSGEWSNLDAMGAQSDEALSDVTCPSCAVQTARMHFQGHGALKVDRCPSCHGLWLDRGELDAVHDAVVEYGETHGTLTEKPQGWSTLHWMAYQLARQWSRGHPGAGVE